MKKELNKLPPNTFIENIKLSARNKKLIDNYLKNYINSLHIDRIYKYKYSLTRFADLIEKDFDNIKDKEEVIKINNIINKSNLSPKSLHDIVSEVKKFYKDCFEDKPFTHWIVTKLKSPTQKGSLRLPEEMPKEKLIYNCIKACGNSRDKFFISLIGLDGALRPIEARRSTWGSVKKDKHGYFIVVDTAKKSGDKSTRTIRIIKSEPYFMQWSKDYPTERNDNAFIFINFSNLKPINDGTIASLFKRLKKKLEIKGRFYPYLLRHGLITQMSKDPRIAPSVLKAFVGHSQRSNTIGEYQHHGDDDLKDMQLVYNGIKKKKEERIEERKPIKCPKCNKANEYDADFCQFCNMALSQKRMVEIDKMFKDNNELMFKQVQDMIDKSRKKK